MHQQCYLSSQSRPGRGTNRKGTYKWWTLAVDRNVDGGYTTQVTITGDIANKEHSLQVNTPIVFGERAELITTT